MASRTTHRSSSGKKLYAKRRKDGTFSDIQTYQRAHAADLRQQTKSEVKASKARAKAKAKSKGKAKAKSKAKAKKKK